MLLQDSHELFNRVVDYLQNQLRVLLLQLVFEGCYPWLLPLFFIADLLDMSGEPVNDPRLLLLDLVHLFLLAEYPVGSVSELTQTVIRDHVALLVEGFFDFLRKLFAQLVLNSDNLILNVALFFLCFSP